MKPSEYNYGAIAYNFMCSKNFERLKLSKKFNAMETRKQLLAIISELPEEHLSSLLELVLLLKKQPRDLKIESQAHKNWLSAENDIYDELFADAIISR